MELETLKEYLDAIDSKSSTPGGGSVGALVGELGICLGRMYGHLSIHTKAFKELPLAQQELFVSEFEKLSEVRELMDELIYEDMKVYDAFCFAYKDKSENRSMMIQEATQQAILVPLKMMRLAYASMIHCEALLPYGNKRAVSDCGIAILFAFACVESSYLNVSINLVGLEDQIARSEYQTVIDEIKKTCQKIKENNFQRTIAHIKG